MRNEGLGKATRRSQSMFGGMRVYIFAILLIAWLKNVISSVSYLKIAYLCNRLKG